MIQLGEEVRWLLYFWVFTTVAVLGVSGAPSNRRAASAAPALGHEFLFFALNSGLLWVLAGYFGTGTPSLFYAALDGGLLAALDAPLWLVWLIVLPLMDATRYGVHVALHDVPILWRVHKVHHADPELDFTTSLRFHPFEIIISLAARFIVAVAIGAPPLVLFTDELIRQTSNVLTTGISARRRFSNGSCAGSS